MECRFPAAGQGPRDFRYSNPGAVNDRPDISSGSKILRAEAAPAAIHVCPVSAVQDVLAQTRARYLITVINEHMMLETPRGILADDHLRLACNDIIAPQPGLVCPSAEHVAELIGYVRRWNHGGPLVVHCFAGISRSTAAAFIALCALNPQTPEPLIASRLRSASPTAAPNRLLVELADEALGRDGRMVGAIDEIGAGDVTLLAASPFALESRLG